MFRSILFCVAFVFIASNFFAVQDASAHMSSKPQCRAHATAKVQKLKPWNRDVKHWRGQYRRCWGFARKHRFTHMVTGHVMSYVRACESGRRNRRGKGIPGTFNYRAKNKRSTASGAYQYLNSTWGGHGGYRRAMDAPRWMQDRRAIRDFRRVGLRPWYASRHCWSG